MAKRDWSILKGILITYGIWLLFKAFRRPKQVPGIHGLPLKHNIFEDYTSIEGKELFKKDLLKLDKINQKKAENVILKAELSVELRGNWIEFFKGDIITGELKSGQVRILFFRLDERHFVTLNVFLKKDNATDIFEKEKARRRILSLIQRLDR